MVLPELVTATINEFDRQADEMRRQFEAIAMISSKGGTGGNRGDPPGSPPLLRRIPLIGSFAR